MIRKQLVILLSLTVIAGCASNPYPELSDDSSLSAESGAESGEAAAAATIEAETESLAPPVSQEVYPLPPDPKSLPEADKRQLDIRVASQRFNYFEDDQLVWTGPVSSGKKEHPTPKGSYHVQSKLKNKRSGSYTNYFDQPTPMPYALQFRGPYWVHEGYVTGKPESHGCVRLRHEDAKFVFARIKQGDRVVIGD